MSRARKRCSSACIRIARTAICSAPPAAIARRLVRGSLQRIAEEGAGVLVYLHQTGLGTAHRRRQDHAAMTALAAGRPAQHEVGIGAQILSDLGLAHDPPADQPSAEIVALEGFGIEIVEQVPMRLNRERSVEGAGEILSRAAGFRTYRSDSPIRFRHRRRTPTGSAGRRRREASERPYRPRPPRV